MRGRSCGACWKGRSEIVSAPGRQRVAILGYHKIGPPSPSAWETWYYVPTDAFRRQMEQLRDGGWEVLDATRLLRGLDDPSCLGERSALIAFDDAYRSVLMEAAPVLREFHFPAIVFVP